MSASNSSSAAALVARRSLALVREWVAKEDLLSYLEANMRVYNRHGRRDNKYKARIKILVSELGLEEYRRQVEEEFAAQNTWEKVVLPQEEIDRITAYFAPPKFETLPATSAAFEAFKAESREHARWAKNNLRTHHKALRATRRFTSR
jgi:sulfite reductase (NADPH) hemoprotein beta-component